MICGRLVYATSLLSPFGGRQAAVRSAFPQIARAAEGRPASSAARFNRSGTLEDLAGVARLALFEATVTSSRRSDSRIAVPVAMRSVHTRLCAEGVHDASGISGHPTTVTASSGA